MVAENTAQDALVAVKSSVKTVDVAYHVGRCASHVFKINGIFVLTEFRAVFSFGANLGVFVKRKSHEEIYARFRFGNSLFYDRKTAKAFVCFCAVRKRYGEAFGSEYKAYGKDRAKNRHGYEGQRYFFGCKIESHSDCEHRNSERYKRRYSRCGNDDSNYSRKIPYNSYGVAPYIRAYSALAKLCYKHTHRKPRRLKQQKAEEG